MLPAQPAGQQYSAGSRCASSAVWETAKIPPASPIPGLHLSWDAEDWAELGQKLGGGSTDAGEHISHGDGGLGSGCDSLECCLLFNGCWVVLLSSLIKLWALRAGMGNRVLRMGFGERISPLSEFAMLPVAPGAGSVSPPGAPQNVHNPNVNVV